MHLSLQEALPFAIALANLLIFIPIHLLHGLRTSCSDFGFLFFTCFHKVYMNVHTCVHNAFLCKWTCSLYSFSKHCAHTQMHTYSTLTLLHKWNLVRRHSCAIHLHTYTHTPWQTLNLSNDGTHTIHTCTLHARSVLLNLSIAHALAFNSIELVICMYERPLILFSISVL